MSLFTEDAPWVQTVKPVGHIFQFKCSLMEINVLRGFPDTLN